MKKPAIKRRPAVDPVDALIESKEEPRASELRRAAEEPKEPMVRLTFDLTQSAHLALKIRCAMERRTIADYLRELIDNAESSAAGREGRV